MFYGGMASYLYMEHFLLVILTLEFKKTMHLSPQDWISQLRRAGKVLQFFPYE